MTHYSANPASVRVDFFKPSGKWYTSEEMIWTGGSVECDIYEAFKKSLRDTFEGGYEGLTAVCLHPYHEFAHPLMIVNWG